MMNLYQFIGLALATTTLMFTTSARETEHAVKRNMLSDFCSMKQDGSYCDQNLVKTCKSKNLIDAINCQQTTCNMQQSMGKSTATCGSVTTEKFCRSKSDGRYCDGAVVKICPGGGVVSICHSTLDCNEQFNNAACGTVNFCAKESSRTESACDGKYVKFCSNSEETSSVYCGESNCNEYFNEAECGEANFCSRKIFDGTYCDGATVVKSCASSETQSFYTCQDGRACVEDSYHSTYSATCTASSGSGGGLSPQTSGGERSGGGGTVGTVVSIISGVIAFALFGCFYYKYMR